MRLYFKPGACSLASRIVLTELDLPHETIKVDTETGLTESGADYRAINPRGYVPALELKGGAVITENPAILQYLADRDPKAELAPANGTIERAYLQQWLNFTSSELHKAFGAYFGAPPPEGAEKEKVDAMIARRLGDVERGLADGRSYILGERFTVVDAYLFVVLNWSNFIGFDLKRWPHVVAFMARMACRPAVRVAMLREGLIQEAAA